MSDLTAEQVQAFADAWYHYPGTHPAEFKNARARIDRLRDAGWTVEPSPEPLFWVEHIDGTNVWTVVSRLAPRWAHAAQFFGDDTTERYAQEHSDRLNAEHGGGS